MKNIVIIHGLGGLKEKYFPHLANFCKNLGLEVLMPNLGSYHDDGGINYELWKSRFDESVASHIKSETIVVANSLGTQFAVKYFTEKQIQIKAYISVSGASKITRMRPTAPQRVLDAKPISANFEPSLAEFETFKNLQFPKFSFFSNNDRFFEMSNLENYAKLIGSKPLYLPNHNHFDKLEDGTDFTKFVELEKLIENLNK